MFLKQYKKWIYLFVSLLILLFLAIFVRNYSIKSYVESVNQQAENFPAGLLYRLHGHTSVDEFGHSVAMLGDVNNDGYKDILIGAPNENIGSANAGAARVYSGRNNQVLHVFAGDAEDWRHGSGVGNAGDIDRDGMDDVIVGMKTNGKTGLGPGGGARVFSGNSGKLLHTVAGGIAYDKFGQSVTGLGDVNGDGWSDFAVGAPATYKKNAAGYVQVYSGADGKSLFKLTATPGVKGDRFGFHINRAGDINGDGHADILVGAIGDADHGYHSGAAYVFSGLNGKLIYRVTGDASPDELGHAVSSTGDYDGDSHPDFLAATFNPQGIGYTRVYGSSNSKQIFEMRGDEVGDGYGHSAAGVGDVNGDGVMDILVGAPDAHLEKSVPWYKRWLLKYKTPGYARVYSGVDGSVIATYNGTRNKHVGYVVSAAGDVNNDGFADMLLGSTVFNDVGEVWVVSACGVFSADENKRLYLSWQKPAKPENVRGSLKINGMPANTRGWLNACKPDTHLCNHQEALFSLPYTIAANGDTATIPFSPRMSDFAGKRVELVIETAEKVIDTGMEALLCP